MIWCPRCHYKTVLNHFPDGVCPQCHTPLRDPPLRKDPYSPNDIGKAKKQRKAIRYEFEQQETVSGDLKSRTIDPTFGIKGRI